MPGGEIRVLFGDPHHHEGKPPVSFPPLRRDASTCANIMGIGYVAAYELNNEVVSRSWWNRNVLIEVRLGIYILNKT